MPEIHDDEEAVDQLARAAAAIKSPRSIPMCVQLLARRTGRESVREALVAIGEPALEALDSALHDADTERHVRLHIPQTIGRFGSQRATDILTNTVEREADGLIRYKALRALGHVVTTSDVRVDRVLIEKEARRNLEEHVRLLSFRAAVSSREGGGTDTGTRHLLEDLLADKLRQSMERAFRLLKIAHREEDIHRVHNAALSPDKRARASAAEFLDVLLARRDQQPLRELLRIVVDEASDVERVERAASDGRLLVRSRAEALSLLIDDRDDALAALAAHYALAMNDTDLRGAVARAGGRRPSLRAMLDRLYSEPVLQPEAAGG
jgi:hypothetical protein